MQTILSPVVFETMVKMSRDYRKYGIEKTAALVAKGKQLTEKYGNECLVNRTDLSGDDYLSLGAYYEYRLASEPPDA